MLTFWLLTSFLVFLVIIATIVMYQVFRTKDDGGLALFSIVLLIAVIVVAIQLVRITQAIDGIKLLPF